MVAGGDVRLDAAGFLQRARQEFRRDVAGIDVLAVDLDRLVGDDVGGEQRILVAFAAVARVDIVDQAFVQRPGVDLAFPLVDDRVAEAVDFGFLVGVAGLPPGVARRLQRRFARGRDQRVDRLVERFCRDQRIFELGVRNDGVVLDDGGRIGGSLCRLQGQHRRCRHERQRRGADEILGHDPLLFFSRRDRNGHRGTASSLGKGRGKSPVGPPEPDCHEPKVNWCQSV
ncbi:hypothetical protein D9M72_415880 [compost metagenome]